MVVPRRRLGRVFHPPECMDRFRRSTLVAFATLIVGLSATPAPAQDPGVDQYVESLPAAEGPRVPGVSAKGAKPAAELPRDVARQLERRRRGALLKALATSPTLGANTKRSSRSGGGGERGATGTTGGASDRSGDSSSSLQPVSVLADVLTGGSGIGLLALFLLIGGSGVAIAMRGRARRTDR